MTVVTFIDCGVLLLWYNLFMYMDNCVFTRELQANHASGQERNDTVKVISGESLMCLNKK